MPKLACKCGNVINLSEIPCRDGYLLLSEAAWDQIGDSEVSEENYQAELRRLSSEVYLCSSCGRLLVLWTPEQMTPTYYQREEE